MTIKEADDMLKKLSPLFIQTIETYLGGYELRPACDRAQLAEKKMEIYNKILCAWMIIGPLVGVILCVANWQKLVPFLGSYVIASCGFFFIVLYWINFTRRNLRETIVDFEAHLHPLEALREASKDGTYDVANMHLIRGNLIAMAEWVIRSEQDLEDYLLNDHRKSPARLGELNDRYKEANAEFSKLHDWVMEYAKGEGVGQRFYFDLARKNIGSL